MHFLNVPHSVASVGRLVRASGGASPGLPDLHAAYREAIAQMRPFGPPQAGVSMGYEREYWGTYLQENEIFENIFVGVGETDDLHRKAWAEQTRLALAYTRAVA